MDFAQLLVDLAALKASQTQAAAATQSLREAHAALLMTAVGTAINFMVVLAALWVPHSERRHTAKERALLESGQDQVTRYIVARALETVARGYNTVFKTAQNLQEMHNFSREEINKAREKVRVCERALHLRYDSRADDPETIFHIAEALQVIDRFYKRTDQLPEPIHNVNFPPTAEHMRSKYKTMFILGEVMFTADEDKVIVDEILVRMGFPTLELDFEPFWNWFEEAVTESLKPAPQGVE